MLPLKFRSSTVACALCVVASSSASATSPSTPKARSAPAIDCKKVFKPSDVAGILTAPVTISANALLGTNGCQFETPNGAMITTYLKSDADGKMQWHDASATTDSKYYTSMTGVGDAAFWRTAGSSAWFLAKKGGDYCKVELGITGGAEGDATKTRGVELAKRLATLCTKLFAQR